LCPFKKPKKVLKNTKAILRKIPKHTAHDISL